MIIWTPNMRRPGRFEQLKLARNAYLFKRMAAEDPLRSHGHSVIASCTQQNEGGVPLYIALVKIVYDGKQEGEESHRDGSATKCFLFLLSILAILAQSTLTLSTALQTR